jgi:hypothetical protein
MILVRGEFVAEFLSPGGRVLRTLRARNSATDPALTDLINTYFLSGSQYPNWYFGVISSTGFTGLSSADTMSSHPGWSEVTAYTGAQRLAWAPLLVTGRSVQNSLPAILTMNGNVTMKGLFIASDNTKGGTAGLLWASGLFTGDQQVVSQQVAKLTYSLAFQPTT